MYIHIYGWIIPTLITIAAFFYPWYATRNETGMFAGLGAMLMMGPAMFVAMLSWLVYAFCR